MDQEDKANGYSAKLIARLREAVDRPEDFSRILRDARDAEARGEHV